MTPVTLTRTYLPYAEKLELPITPSARGFDPSMTQGGCTELEQIELTTSVQLELSGEVWNLTVTLENPVDV